jgi:phosphoglycerol transferase
VAFPEVHPVHSLGNYEPVIGFLYSGTLRWSFGGMKGRDGDRFFKALAQQPIEAQLAAVKEMGFLGVWVHRRGYQDNGELVVGRLTSLLGSAVVTHASGEILFFTLRAR